MGRATLAAGAALLAMTIGSSAYAATPKTTESGKACISAQDWATAVRDKSTGVAIRVLTDLDGLEAKQVMERVNAEPPKTRIAADRVVVLGAKEIETDKPAAYVLVAYFNDGCLVASGRADPDGIADLIEGQST